MRGRRLASTRATAHADATTTRMRLVRAFERTASASARVEARRDRGRRASSRDASTARAVSTEVVKVENAFVDALLDVLGANERVACATRADGVRGLFAKTSMSRNDPVLEIPLAEFGILDDPSERTTWSRQLGRALVDVHRRSRASDPGLTETMKTYAMTLPKFGGEAIGLANNPDVASALADAWDCREAASDMQTFREQISNSYEQELALDPTLREDEWRWALSMVHSRTFRIEDEYGRRATRRALIAAADLLNHSSVRGEVNCDWSANDDYFVVTTTRDVRAGEELCISYGEQCDRHFALFYGFLPSQNPFNRVKLFFNGREALDWYQELCGATPDAPGWSNEKERVVKLVCDKYGTYKMDKSTGLRRRVIQDLYLGEGGKVSDAMLLLFNEMCGDEEMAIAAIRERASELRANMLNTTERVEAALAGSDAYSQSLVREYRRRKIDLLSHIV